MKDDTMARALDYMLCIACGQRQGATNRLTAVTAERDRLRELLEEVRILVPHNYDLGDRIDAALAAKEA